MRGDRDEDFGEPLPYDPDFRGPLKRRSCTDILCLIFFLLFLVCWGGIGWYAFAYGDLSTSVLLVPKDSSGSRCGIDAHVLDKKYLFFFDLTACLSARTPFTCDTPQICVKECPSTNYIKDQLGTLDTQYCNEDGCPKWYLESVDVQKRCVPDISKVSDSLIEQINRANISLTLDNLKSSISIVKVLAQAEQIGQNIVQDITNYWWKILIGIGAALVVCLLYILILRWLAAPVVWVSIVGVVVALAAGLYFTVKEYIDIKNQYDIAKYEEVKADLKTKKDLWLAGLIIVSVVFAIIFLMLVFLRKRITLAIALIEEGSKAVASTTSSLFFPIFPWVLQVGVVGFAIATGLFLSTTGEPLYQTRNVPNNTECVSKLGYADNVICDPLKFSTLINRTDVIAACGTGNNITCKFIKMQNDVIYPFLQFLNVFGFFWLAFFVSALGQMVLASVFAQWYWTFNKSKLPFFSVTKALGRTIRYHLGTLAFGSLIIAICRMIRVVLEYIDRKLKKYDNAFVKAILCFFKCFFWCLEKFLKFINKNAYIMCAVHGKNFCHSAKDAFLLLMRNILRVFVLDKVTDFLFFLSKLLVTLGVGACSYVVFATNLTPLDNSDLNYVWVPIVIIMIVTFMISSLFFSVYSMAVDTLFLCFLEDCERNNGSANKPYYMSRNLMRIFGKNNKKS